MTIPELASLLGVTSLNLYLAQTHDDAYGSIRDSVAVFFGFTCWSELLTQARMDEAREIHHANGSGRRRLLYIETDNRPSCEQEPCMVLARFRNFKGEVLLWVFDGRFYIDQAKNVEPLMKPRTTRFWRIQRFEIIEAQNEFYHAVKELS
jgi:hypothetical protein